MSSYRDILGGSPQKCLLVNLATQTEIPFLINPDKMEIAIQAIYSKKSPLGFSGRRIQFSNNENATINFSAVFDELVAITKGGRLSDRPDPAALRDSPNARSEAELWTAQLQQFIYPRASNTINGASPPPTQFIWPGAVSMRVAITSIKSL
jgi:hypothetical protein